MTNNHKYNRSEGCSICGTKNSTSQFRPWYEHYTEETYCRVFKFESMEGRRGHVCNPCVLYIKRAINNLNKDGLSTDPTKRLDSKLKGCHRPVITDIYPPDSNSASSSQQTTLREQGYCARNLRIRPRYVFTGKPYIKLKSVRQLIPAGPYQDMRELLEDEDDAEKDLKFYRRVTLKKGVKTLAQKAEEKRQQQALEHEKLFGEIGNQEKTKKGRRSAQKSKISDSDSLLNIEENSREYQTRAKASKIKGTEKEEGWQDLDDVSDDSDDTDSSEELVNDAEDITDACGGKSPSISPVDEDWEDISTLEDVGAKRKRKLDEEEEAAPSKQFWGSDNTNGENSVSGKVSMARPAKKNRRVMRQPVKNFKRPKISFMDCSYWQKFRLCCMTVYMGEGGNAVMGPRDTSRPCPFLKRRKEERLQQQREAQEAATSVPTDLDQDSSLSKDTAADQELEVSSTLSSGEDEMNDNRNNFSSSPVVDASLMHKPFHFFGEQNPDLAFNHAKQLQEYFKQMNLQ